jgi:hypothetical protein
VRAWALLVLYLRKQPLVYLAGEIQEAGLHFGIAILREEHA